MTLSGFCCKQVTDRLSSEYTEKNEIPKKILSRKTQILEFYKQNGRQLFVDRKIEGHKSRLNVKDSESS